MFRLISILVLSAIVQSAALAQHDDTIRINFSGGTVKEYIAALRQAYEPTESINVVTMPGADEFLMPAVQLAYVGSDSAINLLAEVAQPRPGLNQAIAVEYHGDLFTVRTVPTGRQAVSSVSHVLSVAAVLDAGFTPEDVLTVVEEVLALVGDEYEEPKLRFHEATGLLIARGHPEQMNAIDRVVRQLEVAAAQRSSPRRADRERLEIQAAELVSLRQELHDERANMLDAGQRMAVYEAMNRTLEEELQRARRMIDTLEHELRALRRLTETTNRPAPQPQ